MTQKQPEALRLADDLDAYHTRSIHREAAAELRRLHALNAELLEAWKLEMSDEWECNSYHPKLVAAFAKAEGEQA